MLYGYRGLFFLNNHLGMLDKAALICASTLVLPRHEAYSLMPTC